MTQQQSSWKPKTVIGKILISPILEFIQDSRAVGITLIACTLLSLWLTNSGFATEYLAFWAKEVHAPFPTLHLPHTVLHWINDGLMALFFFLVGLEIKRELTIGELSTVQKSMLPLFAALGGMLVPAGLYFLINAGTPYERGWGIPMATDIAFSLGILSLLGSRVPFGLKVFLTALAIIDDLGGILTIAIFYTETIHVEYLFVAAGLMVLLLVLNKLKVQRLFLYYIPGIILWYCILNSGIHATIAGVLLAFTIPLSRIEELIHSLHDPVNFIIMPLFALANTAIVLPSEWSGVFKSTINYGILAGLCLGKPLGIAIISFIAVKCKLGSLPDGVNWHHIVGAGIIAGIGFTMSIFIATLAFADNDHQLIAKVAIIMASMLSGIAGFTYLMLLSKKQTVAKEHSSEPGT